MSRLRLVRDLPRLAVLAALALVVMGCRTVRPSSLDQWSACVAELEAVSYLYMRTEWDGHVAMLHVELPRQLVEGAEIRFSGGKPPASYREGSDDLRFDSETFEGSIRVTRLRAFGMKLAFDLRVVSPKVDFEKQGSVPLRGIITVPRGSRDTVCY